ncbi:MAG: enoyl-CoA hydratase/isomerase family protein [Candidatus Hermodarchaeota archaeon]
MKREYEFILFDVNNGISTISLNRPEKFNALQYPLLMEIVKVLESIKKDKSIRVIVFEGRGKNFCSGDDMTSMGSEGVKFTPLEDGSRMPHHKVVRLIREIQKPVIALLHGYCLGAGFDLALACDFRLAADNLKMGDHRTTRAHCILSGTSWFLPRIVGFGRATEIIMTGRHLDAKEALKIGLVNDVYPLDNFKQKSLEFIEKIANMPTKCLGYNKSMLNFSQFNELFPSLQHEFRLYCKNIRTYDFGEGMKSFRKKRDPKFKGR